MNRFKDKIILISFILIATISLLLTINGLYKWAERLINYPSYENIIISVGMILLLLFSAYFWWYIPISNVIKKFVKNKH